LGYPFSTPVEKGSRSRIFHDLFHLILEPRPEAVLRAFSALRFGVQRAENPHHDSVSEKFRALEAKFRAVLHQHRHSFIIKVERFPLPVNVMLPAEKGNESDQFFSVLLDFFGGCNNLF